MVESTGLENQRTFCVPWVRIPPSPPLKKWIVQDKSMKKLLLYIIVVFFSLCSNILAFKEDHLNNLLNNKDCMQCDFSGANLSDIKLQNIDISGSNFKNSILKLLVLQRGLPENTCLLK